MFARPAADVVSFSACSACAKHVRWRWTRWQTVKRSHEPNDRSTARCRRCCAEQPLRVGPVPPPEPAGARIISLAKVTCDGVEVTQAIQNMNHDVPLVARKRTVVRVYLSANTGAPISVQGVLKARRLPNGPWRAVRSLGPATIDPAENGQLRPKRESESKSLNFLLPASVCDAGFTEVRLVLLHQTGPFALLKIPANARRKVRFQVTPPLRVRILGVRFQGGSPPASVAPSALDYTLIQSWLERAYPVASVEWSQAVVDAPRRGHSTRRSSTPSSALSARRTCSAAWMRGRTTTVSCRMAAAGSSCVGLRQAFPAFPTPRPSRQGQPARTRGAGISTVRMATGTPGTSLATPTAGFTPSSAARAAARLIPSSTGSCRMPTAHLPASTPAIRRRGCRCALCRARCGTTS